MSKNTIILCCAALFSAFLSVACSNGGGDWRSDGRRANRKEKTVAGSKFQVTKQKQLALSMAYLAYSGEEIIVKWPWDKSIPKQILHIIHKTMPKINVLNNEWKVVWGPAIYKFELALLQDNMMFVAQNQRDPSQYIVAVRGTNGLAILDWVEEDFRVMDKVPWKVPQGVSVTGTPHISKATDIGVDALLTKLVPNDQVPARGQNITTFLTGLAKEKVDICFTGHSLGGALAPTLALWFRQSQGLDDHWDPHNNATVSTIPFAGATAGDADFRDFFNEQLGARCTRVHNTNDMVPNAWQTSTLETLFGLYSRAGIEMTTIEHDLVKWIIEHVKGYEQVETSDAFTFPVSTDLAYGSYLKQAGYQHSHSYPIQLKMPELNKVIQKR